METSDDPVIRKNPFKSPWGIGLITELFFGGDKPDAVTALPEVEAKPESKTATALPQISEAARKNRLRKASLLTRGFTEPKLSTPGLLGL